ncbi:hypothetical protein [Streptomyces mirabilis]|uniref:hypothetical protein n=1 Tax=Streptomyces mirabilis TaxID=68239 RepID=UPI0036D7D033
MDSCDLLNRAWATPALAAAAAVADGGDRLLADALTRARTDGRVTQDLAGAPELLIPSTPPRPTPPWPTCTTTVTSTPAPFRESAVTVAIVLLTAEPGIGVRQGPPER